MDLKQILENDYLSQICDVEGDYNKYLKFGYKIIYFYSNL